jgi:hypothetical protein
MEVKVCVCDYCWEGLEEDNIDEREPCPECGATARKISLRIEEGIKVRESIGGKIKDPRLPSEKKVRIEFFDGYEWSVALEKDVKKSRLIDKREDKYNESVEDPDTGEIIHEFKGTLSDHQGHGYAKFKVKEEN